MKKALFTSLLIFQFSNLEAVVRHIGSGQIYPDLAAAASVAQPGDTLLMHAGTYAGGLFINNLKGTASQWITIKNAPNETVTFEGGSNAVQLSDPAFLQIRGLVFQKQTGNGFNLDDGGSYTTPAQHIVFENCIFRDMAATGNNDLLKLSGLDHFEIRNCQFLNGSAGGSGVDMVGCHFGKIVGCHFENMGSNAIQCKGGSEQIRIERNFFKNGGQRSLNLGGSTGLQFFRPDTAHFEAARLQVFSNVFVGSVAPIAFVGSVEVEVFHNTFYLPEKWVMRILQETVDPDRFVECGDNSFRNNIIFVNSKVSTTVNIGPDTRPETFLFSNNLWFNLDNSNWNPQLPAAEIGAVKNQNPLFKNAASEDFSIPKNSPAVGAGTVLNDPKIDFLGKTFAMPPSIGAFEGNLTSAAGEVFDFGFEVFPNPAGERVFVRLPSSFSGKVLIFNHLGRNLVEVKNLDEVGGSLEIDLSGFQNGQYFLVFENENGQRVVKKLTFLRKN